VLRIKLLALAVVLLATGLTAPLSASFASSAASSAPCRGTSVPQWDHVVVIVMENHGYNQVVGHSPYVDSLIKQCALATNYHGVAYPSLPNYLAMTGGSTFGVHDDKPPSVHPISGQSVFGQVDSRSLEEGMAGNCSSVNRNLYAVKHNPQAYYTAIRSQCQQRGVPLTYPLNLSARFTFITPNMCHDTHNKGCGVAAGDTFLSGLIGKIIADPIYQAGRTALFLTWDTDNRAEGNHVVTVVVAPSVVPGTRASSAYDHYALLRTVEELLGAPVLGGGVSMRATLHL
jgi:hypothetical protein